MAYSKESIYTKALKMISQDEEIVFIADLVIEMGISKPTLYRHIPADCDEFNDIKEALSINRAKIKRQLRRNWADPEASASLQISLYKLLADEDELKRLNNTPERSTEEQPVIKIENYIPLKGE